MHNAEHEHFLIVETIEDHMLGKPEIVTRLRSLIAEERNLQSNPTPGRCSTRETAEVTAFSQRRAKRRPD